MTTLGSVTSTTRVGSTVEFRFADEGLRGGVAACLAAIDARDPFVVPVDPDALLGGDVVAAVAGGEVLGLGWLTPTVEGAAIEVRVRPGSRKQGLGRALFERLAEGQATLVASCDAAHRSVCRFLEHRGFELLGIVFHQRWDGETGDVPPAFRAAEIRDEPDAYLAIERLIAFAPGAWPRPSVTPDVLRGPGAFARAAFIGGEPAGVVVGHLVDDVLSVDGISVARGYRGRGVGRGLLCDVMRRAAGDGLGVTLRVSQLDEDTLDWTQGLGFWTYRTWAWYRRDVAA
jgi:GNAT superfamily N-acetyltransferase